MTRGLGGREKISAGPGGLCKEVMIGARIRRRGISVEISRNARPEHAQDKSGGEHPRCPRPQLLTFTGTTAVHVSFNLSSAKCLEGG